MDSAGYFISTNECRSLLQRGFMVYDALLAWLQHAAQERHNWPAKAA